MVYFDSFDTPKFAKSKICELANYVEQNEKTFRILMRNGQFNVKCNKASIALMTQNSRVNDETLTKIKLATSCYTSGINMLLLDWLIYFPEIPSNEIAELIYIICHKSLDL